MQKVTKLNLKGKYNSVLTNDFRELITEQVGELDTATSFMYLYRRFGEPTFTNKDEYKILYDYRFKHEDLLVTAHASYHEFVYFSLHIPQKRLAKWHKNRTDFWKKLYKKYGNEVFMPYAMLPYGGTNGLTKAQNKKNWKLIDAASETFFSKEDGNYIEEQFKSKKPESKMYTMLRPFESKLCTDFRAKLTKKELDEINSFGPKIESIDGLKEQCMLIANEFKRGFYVRDVAINIRGYESETNIITEYEQTS